MWFQTIKIKNWKNKYKKKTKLDIMKIIIFLLRWFILTSIAFSLFVYIKYIKPLPDIKKLEEISISESSIIYDKNWKELYVLAWDEKRTYVNYSKISKNIINAIVSWEDKNFFENPWVDIMWIFRALFNYGLWKSTKIEWTSTISQQLIKNVFLSNEVKVERKIKEIYLSYAMTQEYSKEKILELYLNKIPFWSNAFWIEQASLTFFGKKAIDLNILESSIITSIPKWPTYYSPYNHIDRLVGKAFFYNLDDEKDIIDIKTYKDLETYKKEYQIFKDFFSKLEWKSIWEKWIEICNIKKEDLKWNYNIYWNCALISYNDLLKFLNDIKLDINDNTKLEYQTWRKDYILWRMLEDKKITFEEYKKAIIDWLWYKFREYRENIKYPHFVMYIKEYLAKKYWEDVILNSWFKIYTTLDSNLQDKAEEILKKQAKTNMERFDANNAALISIDNASWDILAFIWGRDYFNEEIDWNVNMITSRRQPWSTFKPFVYALAIDKNPIWPYTPIYDLKTKFPWNYEPKNFDWKFFGKMSLMTALWNSRNIPAIKAYFLAWWQENIISYLKSAWVKSLDQEHSYWAPLALWAWEVTPLELVQAYSVFPNNWYKIEINPIKMILDSRWNIIEEKKKSVWIKILDEKVAYIMNYMLSNTSSRPAWWNSFLTLKDKRLIWAKTGTSNKLFTKNWKKEYFPWDLWTAGFTPQITTVVWAWNTDWSKIKTSWDWLNAAWPIWRDFMEYANKKLEKKEFEKPENFKQTKISKISWLLAPEWFEESFTTWSYFKNVPKKYDDSLKEIQVDSMCNWLITDKTPSEAIKTGYYVAFHSIDPNRKEWEISVQNWAKEYGQKEFEWVNNIITNYSELPCERSDTMIKNSSIDINTSINDWDIFINWNNDASISYSSANPLAKIQIFIWENMIQEIDLSTLKSWIYKNWINIPSWYEWNYKLIIKIFDTVYLSKTIERNIKIYQKDKFWPKITITNPDKNWVNLYSDQNLNLRWEISDTSWVKTTNIYIDWNNYKLWITDNPFVIEINKDRNISIWSHTITIESYDYFFNKSTQDITLEIMPR